MLWERSPEAYVRRYIYGETFSNPAMQFGKEIAEALEQEESDNQDAEHLRMFLPKYSHREFEIRATIHGVPHVTVPLLGRLDSFSPKQLRIGELKTGVTAWTQRKVNENTQLSFYALLVWLKYGTRPKQIELYWAPTQLQDGQPSLTGEIQTFKTSRSLTDLMNLTIRIRRAWAGIQKVTKEHYAQIA